MTPNELQRGGCGGCVWGCGRWVGVIQGQAVEGLVGVTKLYPEGKVEPPKDWGVTRIAIALRPLILDCSVQANQNPAILPFINYGTLGICYSHAFCLCQLIGMVGF